MMVPYICWAKSVLGLLCMFSYRANWSQMSSEWTWCSSSRTHWKWVFTCTEALLCQGSHSSNNLPAPDGETVRPSMLLTCVFLSVLRRWPTRTTMVGRLCLDAVWPQVLLEFKDFCKCCEQTCFLASLAIIWKARALVFSLWRLIPRFRSYTEGRKWPQKKNSDNKARKINTFVLGLIGFFQLNLTLHLRHKNVEG